MSPKFFEFALYLGVALTIFGAVSLFFNPDNMLYATIGIAGILLMTMRARFFLQKRFFDALERKRKK